MSGDGLIDVIVVELRGQGPRRRPQDFVDFEREIAERRLRETAAVKEWASRREGHC
jgi:hypothetical protein